MYGDAPWIRFLVEDAAQLFSEAFALCDHGGELGAADGFTKSGLRRKRNSGEVVGHLEYGFLRIPHSPENDCVDVYRYGVARQRRFRGHIGDAHSLIDEMRDLVDDRNDEEKPRPAQSDELPEAQNDRLLPLVSDLDAE